MQRRQALKLFAGLALCPLCVSTGFASEGHWSYEGATGPEKWGGLDAADAACSAGGQQSPIDITKTISARQPRLRISWSKRPDTIVNNGHTIQLDFAEGNTLHVGDRRYSSSTSIIRASTLSRASGLQWKCISFTPELTGWPLLACL